MHEMSICQNLIKQVTRIANEHRPAKVKKIHLQVGPLSGVEAELLKTVFPIARLDTLAADAELIVHAQPIRVKCRKCENQNDANLNDLSCAFCGNWQTELVSGDELLLERIELSTQH